MVWLTSVDRLLFDRIYNFSAYLMDDVHAFFSDCDPNEVYAMLEVVKAINKPIRIQKIKCKD